MEKEKGFLDRFKEGFMPASARADAQVSENRRKYGDQYRKDIAEGRDKARDKFIKGFFERK
jgi:hypothetical protein